MTIRFTHKRCKCGAEITIRYEEESPLDKTITVLSNNAYFRSRNWPNYVYCGTCGRRHDLSKFRLLTPENGD